MTAFPHIWTPNRDYLADASDWLASFTAGKFQRGSNGKFKRKSNGKFVRSSATNSACCCTPPNCCGLWGKSYVNPVPITATLDGVTICPCYLVDLEGWAGSKFVFDPDLTFTLQHTRSSQSLFPSCVGSACNVEDTLTGVGTGYGYFYPGEPGDCTGTPASSGPCNVSCFMFLNSTTSPTFLRVLVYVESPSTGAGGLIFSHTAALSPTSYTTPAQTLCEGGTLTNDLVEADCNLTESFVGCPSASTNFLKAGWGGTITLTPTIP